jgi:ATP-dependent Clp protease adaptor protein ClpS
MKYCSHDSLQAEQCATIVHYNGKCAVKKGSFDKLKPICETLLEKGLSAEIN